MGSLNNTFYSTVVQCCKHHMPPTNVNTAKPNTPSSTSYFVEQKKGEVNELKAVSYYTFICIVSSAILHRTYSIYDLCMP